MLYTLGCIVIGEDTVFLVEIDDTKSVDKLKDDIIKKRPNIIDRTIHDATHLTLYKVEIKLSNDDAYIEEVKKQSKLISNVNKLRTWDKLSKVFASPAPDASTPGASAPDASAPDDETIHILVQLPSGESIDPKVGGAIAETNIRTLSPRQLLICAPTTLIVIVAAVFNAVSAKTLYCGIT